ncbi:cytochrome P450 [Nonomuraea basaltis]|uniref:cytochrome P450 n=1 Tax=Nonomuraea basaltis TaxID=2495887 RepID=UPI00198129EB|nr:cytochrome P450 [Nonomuraea basaltis]
MLITRHAEARAVLADPRYVPPPVRQDGREGTLAWLRAHVSRFSTGETHAARRHLVVERLAALDPAELRTAARAMTLERDGEWRGVPTAVLGTALGVKDTSAVAAAASGYLSGEESPEADAAVAELLGLTDLPAVTLLLQGHAATEALIDNALQHAAARPGAPGDAPGPAEPGADVEALLRETLRQDPPLKATRRLDTRTGDEVTIDLVAANRDPDVFAEPGRFDPARGDTPHLTFGYGVRPCPAPAHALALAAGVLEAVLTASLRSPGDGAHSLHGGSHR